VFICVGRVVLSPAFAVFGGELDRGRSRVTVGDTVFPVKAAKIVDIEGSERGDSFRRLESGTPGFR
jgi:hypothetical protein